MACLQVENLTKSFGDRLLFEKVSFGLEDGERKGLIAKNGTGKTTLLNIIAGKEVGDEGSVTIKKDLKIAYLQQDPKYPAELTVLQACFFSDNETVKTIAAYEEIIDSGRQEGLSEILEKMDMLKAWDYELKAKQILSQLKITDFGKKISELSGGELKRVALSNILIVEPDVLILDEPTNHLDLDMIEWLENVLSRSNTTLLMVTHDRYFLDRVCNEIIEIDNCHMYRYKGNYSYFLEKRSERIEALNAETERANNLLRKELDWMRRQPQARATKAKYRIDAFYSLEKKARQEAQEGNIQLKIKSSYIGNKIFEAVDVSKSWGELKILEHFDYVFARYDKLGIVGNNGSGKSTFIKMLIGETAPDTGYFDVGETVVFGYYSQEGLQYDEQTKVIDVVQNIAEVIQTGDGKQLTASQFLQHFLFSPEKQHSFVHKLSGGEKRRLHLCTVLIKNPNFLILDEPTNDLDIVSLNILEDYLLAFKGCLIVVSHDRYFMDKVVDHTFVFKGNAEIKDFPGNYSDYREWKEQLEKEEKAAKSAKTQKETKTNDSEPRKARNDKKKLSFKEQREFEQLEQQITQLEAEKTALETEFGSGAVMLGDELIAKSERIASLINEIDEKTIRWMQLSEWA